MNTKETINKKIQKMFWDAHIESLTSKYARAALPVKNLTVEQMKEMHEAAMSVLKSEKFKGVAVRAEMFALLYTCQPKALFKRVKLSNSVSIYTRQIMCLGSADVSAYKRNLIFLYNNDKKFRALAEQTICAVNDVSDKENADENR